MTIGLLSLVVWGLTTAKFYSLVPSTRMCYSTYLALLFLTPGVWSILAPNSYIRRRQQILVGEAGTASVACLMASRRSCSRQEEQGSARWPAFHNAGQVGTSSHQEIWEGMPLPALRRLLWHPA